MVPALAVIQFMFRGVFIAQNKDVAGLGVEINVGSGRADGQQNLSPRWHPLPANFLDIHERRILVHRDRHVFGPALDTGFDRGTTN